MSVVNKLMGNITDKDLRLRLRIETEGQLKTLNAERLQCLQKIGYVRPRTRLELLYADEYMTDKQFAQILGLGQLIKKYPELTDEQLTKFIVKHKVTLIFLNHVLRVVPDMVSIIRLSSENSLNAR